ncbi:DUF6415 family natural product biosynthesis protein [Streptomyces sp. C36]|uniref:DUF6415 family natural product biosynthesis protein n=1 Tax=Streptomyces sp. C36 TaxID=3237122 RepID=UPI0034C5C329
MKEVLGPGSALPPAGRIGFWTEVLCGFIARGTVMAEKAADALPDDGRRTAVRKMVDEVRDYAQRLDPGLGRQPAFACCRGLAESAARLRRVLAKLDLLASGSSGIVTDAALA